MDKFLEIFASYIMEWQQVAMSNVQYSVALALVATLIGGILVALLNRKKSVSLKQKLIQQIHSQEKCEQKNEKLLAVQKSDEENIANLQLQQDQLTKDLQQSEVQHSKLVEKEDRAIKSLDEIKLELDAMESTLNDKNQRVDQLQCELEEQKIQLSQYVLEQSKVVVMEKEISDFATKLTSAEQQIQAQVVELTNKNELIAQLEQTGQTSEINLDRVSELESQIKKQGADNNVEQMAELENTLQQQNQQMVQFNKKLQSLLTQSQAKTQNENKFSDTSHDSVGMFGNLLNKISFLETVNKTEIDQNQSSTNESADVDVWQNHQMIIDQLIEQLTTHQATTDDQSINIKDANLAPQVVEQPVKEPSTQVDDVAAEMDHLKDKLKGFYHKFMP